MMFSIQFSVCFYSILYVCQSNFIVNMNITINGEIKMETSLDTVNTTHVAIIPKNNTAVENLAENVSKIHLGIDNGRKTDEKNKPIDNIDESLLEKNYSIFGIPLTLNDSSRTDKQQIVTRKVVKLTEADHLESKTASRIKSKLFGGAKEFNITKHYRVKEPNTTVKNEAMTKMNDSSSTDKQQTVTRKVVKLTEADHLENKSASRIKSKLIEGAKKFNITKNHRVKEPNTTVKNEITTKILQNNVNLAMIFKSNVDVTVIFQNNENMTKISPIIDNITDIFQKKNDILKTAEENGFPKNVESNNMTKKTENDNSPKNVKKRDIGMERQVPKDYNPQDFQNHTYKNIKNYDMPKNIQQYDPHNIAQKHEKAKKVYNINDHKPYYQNYGVKNENIIDKTDMPKQNEHTQFYDDSHIVIPQIQTRINNDLVKKSLDEFKMVRRKTHFTMPDILIQNDISKREIERYQDLNYNPKFHEYYDEGKMIRPRNKVELNYYSTDIPNNILYPPDQEMNHIIYPVYEEVDYMQNNYRELNKILGRQEKIIQKLIERQKKPQITTKNPFDKLLEDVEQVRKRRDYTKFNFPTTTTRKTTTKSTTKTTAKPATILSLFDETDVRLALKNDPNVKRLLKIGKLKREKYLKQVKDLEKQLS